MSVPSLNTRPFEGLQNLDHTSASSLKRGRLQVLRAMAQLTSVLMDIEEVLGNEVDCEETDTRPRKRIRLSNRRGETEKDTVLATQIEACHKKAPSSTDKDAISNISSQVQSTNSRKRAREENNNILVEDKENSYEIVLRNNFGGKREEILSCFDCRKLLEALIATGTIENGKLTSNNKDKSSDAKKDDPSSSDANRKKDTPKTKENAKGDPKKKQETSKNASSSAKHSNDASKVVNDKHKWQNESLKKNEKETSRSIDLPKEEKEENGKLSSNNKGKKTDVKNDDPSSSDANRKKDTPKTKEIAKGDPKKKQEKNKDVSSSAKHSNDASKVGNEKHKGQNNSLKKNEKETKHTSDPASKERNRKNDSSKRNDEKKSRKIINPLPKIKSCKSVINKYKNKENIPISVKAANNSVYKEIMNTKTMKKEPNTESILSDRTKQLYELLAGN